MKIITVLGFGVLAYILNGVALSVLWGWFMVGSFGLPAISVPLAIGIGIIVSYLTDQDQEVKKREIGEWIGYVLAKPIVALVIGWIVYQFV